MQTASDDDLIRRAQAGDEESITALYERHHPNIYRYLYYRLGDVSIAEDVTSEVFLRMLRSMSQFRPGSISFQAWLFRIARNLAIDHFRKESIRRQVSIEDEMEPPQESVANIVQRNLDHEYLRKALGNLAEDQRDVITLRFIIGLPILETAQTLNKTEDAVKGLQRRGLLALRQALKDWEVFNV